MARKSSRKPRPPVKNRPAVKNKPAPDPVVRLRREHPDLGLEQARAIVAAGLSFEQWQAREAEARERERQQSEQRIIAFILSRYPQLDRDQAAEIVRRNLTPEEYLRKIAPPTPLSAAERRQAILALVAEQPDLSRAQAGQIVSGATTIERIRDARQRSEGLSCSPEQRAEASRRARKQRQLLLERASRMRARTTRSDAYLLELVTEQQPIEVLRFHAPACRGQLVEVAPYRLTLQQDADQPQPQNPRQNLSKLACAALYLQQYSETVRRQVQVRPEQAALRQHPPYFDQRRDDDHGNLANGSQRGFLLHNGYLLHGTVRWCDCFHLLLALPAGGELFLFLHAVLQSGATSFATSEDPSLGEWLARPPDPPRAASTELEVDRIIVDDKLSRLPLNREHPRYLAHRDAFAQQGFRPAPLLVRRRGDQYYLVDGLRRLVLAREHGHQTVPAKLI